MEYMNKLIGFLKGREHKGELAESFEPLLRDQPKYARIGAFQGKMLMATLNVQGDMFAKSLIFIVSHGDNGAMGLIVNQKIDTLKPQEVIMSLGVTYPSFSFKQVQIPLNCGGPLDEGRGFVLHSGEYHTRNTVAFPNQISISSEKQVLTDAVRGRGPKKLMLALGYAAWARGQLEAEIDMGAWLVLPARPEVIFAADNLAKWRIAADANGINPFRIAPHISAKIN